jgi:hypothetical protein
MKFGKIGATVALSAAVVTGTLLGAAPANALTFGDTLVFSTDEGASPNLAKLTNAPGGLFNFDIGAIEIDVADVFGGVGTAIGDNILTLQQIANQSGAEASYQLVGTNVPWLSGLDDEAGGFNRTFTLTSFILNRESDINPITGAFAFTAGVQGFFEPPTPGVPGIGGFGGFGKLSSTGSTVSGEIEAVPTPAAVLPALIGMGTAALRKKKGEAAEA